MSATEIALLDGILWMRRMGWLLGEYTDGVTGSLLETPIENDWNVTEWEDWLYDINDKLGGDTAARLKWSLLPPGREGGTVAGGRRAVQARHGPVPRQADSGGLRPARQRGRVHRGRALSARAFHEGEEDILQRNDPQPDAKWIGKIATRPWPSGSWACRRASRCRCSAWKSEDEAAADAVAAARAQSGRMTLNQDNARRGEPPYGFAEADMPMLMTTRGVVFLEGASQTAPPGTFIGPPQAAPPGAPPQGAPGGADGQGDDGEQGGSGPAAKSAELAALRNWLGKARNASRVFECRSLTAADVPQYAANPRVVLKADDARPKALSGTGPAGSGTRS